MMSITYKNLYIASTVKKNGNLEVAVTAPYEFEKCSFEVEEISLVEEGFIGAILRIMDIVNLFGLYPDDDDYNLFGKLIPMVW
jgi:hypothetical protein